MSLSPPIMTIFHIPHYNMLYRTSHNFLCSLLVACCCMLLNVTALQAQIQSLKGTVTVAGGENSALATIRIVDQGIGTTSLLDGSYYLEDIAPGEHTVEYSYIGHKTVRQKLTWTKDEVKVMDVVMEEAPIMLTTAFVTPNGEDPAQYILNHVWKKAEQKRASMPAFGAKTSMVLSYSDFDIIKLLPSAIRMMLMGVASTVGFRKVIKLLMKYPELSVSTTADVRHQIMKYTWTNPSIARCSENLTDDEKKTLLKLSDNGDLYEEVYGSGNRFRSKKTKAVLKGSYEDGDQMVFVLEGRQGQEYYEMHVAEDTWDVLKLEQVGFLEHTQIECRPGPGGLYMPVSVNRKLKFLEQSLEEIEKQSAEHVTTPKEEKKMEKKRKEMEKKPEKKAFMESLTERAKARGIQVVLSYGLSISYERK